ncbi:hypothetical protein FS749_009462 [Ceratobasidium sp. UAMH 11750]|nr:hypothetical protein FS749_009462 [Ceratobasidium sp. UAMH 11750]
MTGSSSTRVLSMSELVALLAPHISKRDLVNLASTSWGCFSSSIELVWRELRGVHNLFLLIPGAKCKKYSGMAPAFDLSIPDLETANLSRFQFYAPLVYSLEVSPGQGVPYLFSEWSTLNKYTKSTVLLPNLQTLFFESWNYGECLVAWLTPFLSPNIRQIHIHSHDLPYQTAITANATAALFKRIFTRCPNVTDLTFFPTDMDSAFDRDQDTDSSYSDEGTPDNIGEGTTGIVVTNTLSEGLTVSSRLETRTVPFYAYLRRAYQLQTLATSAYILRPEALDAIGKLPNLGSISVFFGFQDINLSIFNYSDLPANLFTSLCTLWLNLPNVDDVRHIWKITPLVGHLTDLTIELHAHGGFSAARIHYNYFMSFIPTICTRSPNIQKLTLDFGEAQAGARTILPLQTLATLASLPLETLSLQHVQFGEVQQACQVLKKCDTLRNLYLPSQAVDYDDLLHLSQIPGLEYLHVELLWKNVPKLRGYSSDAPPEHSSNIRFLRLSCPQHLERDPELDISLLRGATRYARSMICFNTGD